VARSLVTQLTMFFTMLALALFGGVTIHNFVIILLIGLMVWITLQDIINPIKLP